MGKHVTQWAKNLSHWVTKFSSLGEMSPSCSVKRCSDKNLTVVNRNDLCIFYLDSLPPPVNGFDKKNAINMIIFRVLFRYYTGVFE